MNSYTFKGFEGKDLSSLLNSSTIKSFYDRISGEFAYDYDLVIREALKDILPEFIEEYHEDNLMEYCKRLTIVNIKDRYGMYLDYVDENNKGTFLFSYKINNSFTMPTKGNSASIEMSMNWEIKIKEDE